MTPLLLFDIDGTLIVTRGVGRAAFDAAFEEVLGVPSATAGVQFDGRTDRAIIEGILAALGADPSLVEPVQTAYLRALPASLARRGGEVLPGVEPLLDALRDHVPALGLATGNLREGARHKLERFGLWHRFAAGGFGDRHADRAALVREALDALAAAVGTEPDPARAVVIGDTPLDVAAARALGARCCAVATGRYSVDDLRTAGADVVLTAFTDTTAALDAILSS